MRHAIRAALLAASFVAMPTAAFAAGWQFGVQAGASIPTGNFADSENAVTGYIFGALADYQFASWALGANFSMTGNNHEEVGETQGLGGATLTIDEWKYSTTQFGGHIKGVLPAGDNINLYGILGVGYTKFKEKRTSTYTIPGSPSDIWRHELEQDWATCGKLGAGALWWFSEAWGISGEADYNFMTAKDDYLPYFALSAGAMFRFPGSK